jgi:hypothetical protein
MIIALGASSTRIDTEGERYGLQPRRIIMNVLSLLSSLVAYSFVLSGIYILRLNRKE